MDDPIGRGRARLVEGDVEFDGRDAALLETIAREGSVARAAAELGRSRARAPSRIETLEAGFGELGERRRGGRSGGGSRLTEAGTRLLNRYERLAAAVAAAARGPQTVLDGTGTAGEGENPGGQNPPRHRLGAHHGAGGGRPPPFFRDW